MKNSKLQKFIYGLVGALLATILITLTSGFLSQYAKVERVHKIENEMAIIKTHYTHIQKSLIEIKKDIEGISNERNSDKVERQASINIRSRYKSSKI